jgi:hypothetical protein
MEAERIKTILVETFATAITADDGEISADAELTADSEALFFALASPAVISAIQFELAMREFRASAATLQAELQDLIGCLMMA